MMLIKARYVFAVCAISCAQTGLAQSHNAKQSKESAQYTKSEAIRIPDAAPSRASRASLPNTKVPLSTGNISRPVTLNQVERQTGGKVIGAKPVDYQGRQLNQIKVLMPNGRVVIHQQLFDEQGRSVETVNNADSNPDVRTKSTDH
jgi:hypothetical protein